MARRPQPTAYSTALRWLARREYCEAELRTKLGRKEFSFNEIDDAINRLLQHEYLNEQRFVESFMRARMRRGETPWLAMQKARLRGASSIALEQVAVQDFDADAACADWISRRDPDGLRFSDSRRWQREARFLRQKGFDSATILRALQRGHVEE